MTVPPIHSRVEVALSDRAYSIVIGQNLLAGAGALVRQLKGKVSHAFCISDASVAATHGDRVIRSIEAEGLRVSSVSVPSGERSKSVEQLGQLWESMLQERCDRGSLVVAIGGGVIGDLAGFAAASFARGIRLIQVPTTLLSQVDSSVGGKTGINLSHAKNMVGAFWQPSLVMIDLDTLQTLPNREFLSGLAEVVKYGVIMDAPFFEWLEANTASILERDPKALNHLIRVSCECKAKVVAADERETTGLRAILNYGHTFGHAIEAATQYGEVLHGEAISIGMTMAAQLACNLGRIDQSLVQRQTRLLQSLGLPIDWKKNRGQELWRLMQHDKKVQHGTLSFILPSKLGSVESVAGIDASSVLPILEGSL
ncbi:MAG: 3-dehydroquinate synthase [Pirellulales bacterium]